MPSSVPLDARTLYDRLFNAYGPQHWWPGDTPFEVVVGAVLTQNTAWHNVSIAIGNLQDAGLLSLSSLLDAPEEQVKRAIRPAGFFNVKYARLLPLLRLLDEHGGLETLQSWSTTDLRTRLLAAHGIGPETADSILLYALNRPVFVIDSYTRRLLTRLGHSWATASTYDDLQRWFVNALRSDANLFNEYHALIVQHGKTRCRVKPQCEACPLRHVCAWEPARPTVPAGRTQPAAPDGV